MVDNKSTIMHIDMDSYFASVQQQFDPVLQGRPIAVSGKPGTRTVVAAASKEAKKFGVHSGMASHDAVRLCPELLLVPGNPELYQQIHRRILGFLQKFTPLLEVFSIDEWFLDIKDTATRFGSVAIIAAEVKRFLREQYGDVLTCSIGVGSNRTVAKIASDLAKPDGLVWLKNENQERQLLMRTPLMDICGIGFRINRRLNRLGIFTVQQLIDCPEKTLVKEFGPQNGPQLQRLACGQDGREVLPFYQQKQEKSVSCSTTLPFNTLDFAYLGSTMFRLSTQVASRLRKRKLFACGIRIWVRNQDFMHWAEARSLLTPSNSSQVIYQASQNLFSRIKFLGQVRAIGVVCFDLTKHQQLNLFCEIGSKRKFDYSRLLDQVNQRVKGKNLLFPAIFLKSEWETKVAGYYPGFGLNG